MFWNKKNMYKESFEKVAEFWAENTFRKKMNMNNGDNSPAGGMTFLLGNMVSMQAQNKVTGVQIEQFKNNLVKKMHEAYKKNKKLYTTNLNVDYGPCKLLAVAANEVGIEDLLSFPWKSSTWIEEDGTAKASLGYHGEIKIL